MNLGYLAATTDENGNLLSYNPSTGNWEKFERVHTSIDVPDFQKYKDARHEQMNTKNLPEVKVNSDYKKWLLIGGGVLAVYWLFFRK